MPKQAEDMKFAPQMRPRSGQWIECETCGRVFYVRPSRIKQAQAHGVRIRFCSSGCYIKTGDKNPMWGKKHTTETKQKFTDNPNRPRFQSGPDNPNVARYAFGFKGTTIQWWQDHLRNTIGHCQACGYEAEPHILQVHHIDRNRRHNTNENLLLLCPNCHQLEHYHAKDGGYQGRPNGSD